MKNYKKVILSVFMASFLFVGAISPRPAKAIPVEVVADPSNWVQYVWNVVQNAYNVAKGLVGTELYIRTLDMYMQSLAYDVANELATGGQGQNSQYRSKGIAKSLEVAQEAALGEFVGALSEQGFDELGIDLCNPSLSVKLNFTLSLIDSHTNHRPTAACNWRSVVNNWEDFEEDIQKDLVKVQLRNSGGGATSTRAFFEGISEKSELGDYLKLSAEWNNTALEALKVEELRGAQCRDYIEQLAINEDIKTRCMDVLHLDETQWDAAVDASQKKLEARKEAATTKNLADVLIDAADMFASTFTSKLMKSLVSKGAWSVFGSDSQLSQTGQDPYEDVRETLLDKLRGGADLTNPRNTNIVKSYQSVQIDRVESFSYLTDFSICPDNFRKPDNCTMSPSFLQAITSEMTIQDAIHQGIIDGGLVLIGPEDPSNKSQEKCYRDALCHSNLIKLRKANIIPVGWELASLRGPVTLQEAIDCFEDGATCRFNASNDFAVDGVAHNPFYHLIDGDWVMKAPETVCDAMVYSPVLESKDGANRQEYCADSKVCLREDDQGNCLEGQYSYCTRSENIWRLDGTICEDGDIYSGCLAFYHDDYGESSYIESTLDYCTSDEAGCRRYSQERNNLGDWELQSIDTDTDDLFLNRQASDCESDSAGCSEFIVMAADRGINVIPNGSFKDLDNDGVVDGWSSEGIGYDAINTRIANGYPWGNPPAGIGVSVQQDFQLLPNTYYALSARGAQRGGTVDDVRIAVSACDGNTCGTPGNTSYMVEGVGTCVIANGNHHNNADLLFEPAGTEMEWHSCTFLTDENVKYGRINVLGDAPAATADVWIDEVKLEVVSNPSAQGSVYSEYGLGGIVYMNDDRFMCLAEEVGCQGYTPVNGDPMIPAVISQEDLCPSECVGYSTFTEQPDLFDVLEHPTNNPDVRYYNFIYDTAQTCPMQEVGCEQFTNLDEVAAGGEGLEYFTYLRQCVPPNRGTIYYTWEGNDVAGYQLKTWNILESNNSDAPCTNIEPGGSTCQDNGSNEATCSAAELLTNPNCRQFFDVNNNSHLRLQDRVIFADDNCHDYRRTESGEEYRAIPELSLTCSAENNGCRSYYGNNANNVRNVLADNFENGVYSPWEPAPGRSLDISVESLNNNGHSLKAEIADSAAVTLLRDLSNLDIKKNKEYIVSWWMKPEVFLDGIAVSINVHYANGSNSSHVLADGFNDSAFQDIPAGNWNYYTASGYLDITSTQAIDRIELAISNQGAVDGADLFLDNITLKEVENSFAVVRDSWNTPFSCDDPYVGYHLGCQTYIDNNNFPYNLKSFSYLCREDAIGCTPAIDTHNSTYPYAETFHPGDYSEISIPEDSLTYLVPDSSNYCLPEFKGCSALGLPDRQDSTIFTTEFKINNPDQYDNTLCNNDALGCEEYNSAKGNYYFKDPGTQTCTYREGVLWDGNVVSGWFATEFLDQDPPVGCNDNNNGTFEASDVRFLWDYCEDPASPGTILNYYTQENCVDNGGDWIDQNWAATCPATNSLCTAFTDPSDPVDCDPTINNPSIEGYCSNSNHTTERDCNLGVCSDPVYRTQTGCVGAGETWEPPGLWTSRCKDYYYYYDDLIDETSCNGQIDQNSGCVLFNESNNWNGEHSQLISLYDSSRTYRDNLIDNIPVSPVACDPTIDPGCDLDANKVIKVSKDRQCAEWLACKSSSTSYDKETGEYRIICDNLASCVEYKYNSDSSVTQCKTWGSYEEDAQALTFEVYQSRATGPYGHLQWSDKEYTGFSIPNMLAVKDLTTYDFGENDEPLPRLVYDHYDTIDTFTARRYFADCVDSATGFDLDGQACTAEINDEYFAGECREGICYVSPRVGDTNTSTFGVETRGYATVDAPFPAAIETEDGERISRYGRANICEDGESFPNGCEDVFSKVTYGFGEQSFYFPEGSTMIPGICTSGDSYKVTVGLECTDNATCDSYDEDGSRHDGVCSLRKEEVKYNNWIGVCAEYDEGVELVNDTNGYFMCNQWYPVDKINGVDSLYDNHVGAGYYNISGQDALFCAMAEPYVMPEDRYYCGWQVEIDGFSVCTVLVKIPQGARIHTDAAANYADVFAEYYLRGGYTRWAATDDPTGGDFPAGFGQDWIDRNDATYEERPSSSCVFESLPLRNGRDAFFDIEDFGGNIGEEIQYLPIDNINNMIDTDLAATPIEFFYYDEEINYQGRTAWRAGVPLPNYSIQYHGYTCPDESCPNDLPQCPSTHHETLFDARYKSPKCSTFGPRRHQRWRTCNPLDHNIYIKAAAPDPTPICGTTNCINGLTPSRGLECLQDPALSPRYDAMLNQSTNPNTGSPWPWMETVYVGYPPAPRATSIISAMTSMDLCYGDPNCQFIYCMENTNAPVQTSVDRDGNSVNALFCEEYGDVVADDVGNIVAITGCFQYLYQLDNNDVDGYSPLTGVDTILAQEVNNDTEPYGCLDPFAYCSGASADNPSGCTDAGGTWITNDTSCSFPAGQMDPSTYEFNITWNPISVSISWEEYDVETLGTPCEGLDCYQQCQLIAHLDDEGDLSWVRTDIWWRNERTGERVIDPAWRSKYFSNNLAQYVLRNDASYDDIPSETYTYETASHFGAALGILEGGGKVVVDTPLGYSVEPLGAATFFSNLSLASSTLNIAWTNYGQFVISNLFAKVYLLDWQAATQEYAFYADSVVATFANNENDYAGDEYSPRVLAVCATGPCEIRNPITGELEGYEEGVTVNNSTGGMVTGQGGSLFTSLKFYFHAHPDHMPISSIDVDWGDETAGYFFINPGKYKNHIPECNSEINMPGLNNSLQGFGGTDAACHEGYKVFYHDYQFDLDNAGVTHACIGVNGQPSDPNASCFRPTIRVADKWGLTTEYTYPGWIVVYEE